MSYFIGIIVGVFIGWVWAHHTVVQECNLLGGFYVGKRVYKCSEIKE